ncbi:MAG: hypothetical protein EKE20_15140 [Candidatus Symbiopectobacterium sp. Dall1.0]|nr:hypothetical protein [Candidatus Symbiopectobacterium sp. Dall1.0]
MAFTHSTTLPVGIYHDGVLHREVTVRLATVGDEIAVIEAGIPESGTAVGILARCLTELGTLAPEDITYSLLCDTLVPEDYAVLHAAQLEAKKKLSALKPACATTVLPLSDSDSTASAPPAPAALTL